VVEDEDMVRKLMCSQLKECGYRVLEASNGEEALHAAQEYVDEINLMVSDIQMPFMDGHELAERIRSIKPEIRIVFVSGYNEESVKSDAEFLSPYPLLSKPYNASDLLRVVEDTLDEAKKK
jgi:two-component system cell cycle sensor histidine kinase/response regulator CckA